jgi:hypothetical protein
MSKTASLTAGLVAKKGQAVPAAVAVAPDTSSAAQPAAASSYYKALTVKDAYLAKVG